MLSQYKKHTFLNSQRNHNVLPLDVRVITNSLTDIFSRVFDLQIEIMKFLFFNNDKEISLLGWGSRDDRCYQLNRVEVHDHLSVTI